MLEKLLKIKQLGTPDDFDYLFRFLSLGDGRRIIDLQSGTLTWFKSSERFQNSIHFLSILGFIEIRQDFLFYRIFYSRESLLKRLIVYFSEINALHQFLPEQSINYSVINDEVVINNRFIPLAYFVYRNLLIELGLFKRKKQGMDTFLINDDLKKWFLNDVVPLIEKSDVDFSLEELKRAQLKNEVLGDEAEQFVFSYEKRVLSGHPRFLAIKLVSKINVSAGYDIKSFLSIDSVVLDKEIEVKSYSGGQPYFYWSRNEFERAKKSGDRYFLYLVDRTMMDAESYNPIQIQNPYENLMMNPDWSTRIEGYYFEFNQS